MRKKVGTVLLTLRVAANPKLGKSADRCCNWGCDEQHANLQACTSQGCHALAQLSRPGPSREDFPLSHRVVDAAKGINGEDYQRDASKECGGCALHHPQLVEEYCGTSSRKRRDKKMRDRVHTTGGNQENGKDQKKPGNSESSLPSKALGHFAVYTPAERREHLQKEYSRDGNPKKIHD
eukprot:6214149-Pleurochrysis_carterae.AAC.6